MEKKNWIKCISFLLGLVLLGLVGCSVESQQTNPGNVSESNTATQESLGITNSTNKSTKSTKIHLSDKETTIEGEGVSIDGSTVTISNGGVYTVDGTLTDGQIIINAPKTVDVELILENVTITSQKNAAIYCMQANNFSVILAEGSKNTLSDAVNYTYADAENEEPNAALFSKVNISIGGTGALVINGNFQNGIGTKDDLVISGGSYTVNAKNHGIRGRDSLTVLGGTFNITSGNDGLQSNNDKDVSKGWIRLDAGTFTIESGHDGIQAETSLSILDADITITAGGGADSTIALDEQTNSESYKGIKAGGNISLLGGNIEINSADDAIHSNSNITIQTATANLYSGDDGVHADGELTIESGIVDVKKSYEGLEASVMNLNGGEISIVASDDGINIAGGTDDDSQTTQRHIPGRPDHFTSNNNRLLSIKGGTIFVNAKGDGIDVNGNAEMTGGTVVVNGPTDGGNGSLDYDGTFNITGGSFIATGSSGMAMTPSNTSKQASILLYFSEPQNVGTTVEFVSQDGERIIAVSPEKEFETILVSSPKLTIGETYTVNINGKMILELTPTETITRISDTGKTIEERGMGGRNTPPKMHLEQQNNLSEVSNKKIFG